MSKPSDIRVIESRLYLLPVQARLPIKFGDQVVTEVACARVALRVADRRGHTAEGWGETPLSAQWAWPSTMTYAARHKAMVRFCVMLAEAWVRCGQQGHPMEVGHDYMQHVLPALHARLNGELQPEPMPHLAALVCASAFDLALHDAYGTLLQRPVYSTYTRQFMNVDLGAFLEPEPGSGISFTGRFPCEFLHSAPPASLPAWHLVGGLDPIDDSDLTGREPRDGEPVLLADWISRDGLRCLKIKLRGNNAAWDLQRIVHVGDFAAARGVHWLGVDFNCMVTEPVYVNTILDQLQRDHPRIHGMILYVEQPFPYDLEASPIDVHSVAARKPLFMDESAHDWRLVRAGRRLGWPSIALKTCKTRHDARSAKGESEEHEEGWSALNLLQCPHAGIDGYKF